MLSTSPRKIPKGGIENTQLKKRAGWVGSFLSELEYQFNIPKCSSKLITTLVEFPSFFVITERGICAFGFHNLE